MVTLIRGFGFFQKSNTLPGVDVVGVFAPSRGTGLFEFLFQSVLSPPNCQFDPGGWVISAQISQAKKPPKFFFFFFLGRTGRCLGVWELTKNPKFFASAMNILFLLCQSFFVFRKNLMGKEFLKKFLIGVCFNLCGAILGTPTYL